MPADEILDVADLVVIRPDPVKEPAASCSPPSFSPPSRRLDVSSTSLSKWERSGSAGRVPPMSDRELLKDARRGRHEAIEALVERYWDQAQGIARGILDDARWAEDVTHEAMFSIVGNVGRFDPYRPFAPRLRRVVSSRARDWERVRARRASINFPIHMEVDHA
jgi:Sigma-70 region 2